MAPRGSAGPANCGGSEDFRDLTAEARTLTPEVLNEPHRAPKTGWSETVKSSCFHTSWHMVLVYSNLREASLMNSYASICIALSIALGRHVQPYCTVQLARSLTLNSTYPRNGED